MATGGKNGLVYSNKNGSKGGGASLNNRSIPHIAPMRPSIAPAPVLPTNGSGGQQPQLNGKGMLSINTIKGDPKYQRKGKWTIEEEEFAQQLIKEFEAGTVICVNGKTLRAYLADRLNCAPMRISKKYAGKNKGKSVFLSRKPLGDSVILKSLEHRYIQSVLRESHATQVALNHINSGQKDMHSISSASFPSVSGLRFSTPLSNGNQTTFPLTCPSSASVKDLHSFQARQRQLTTTSLPSQAGSLPYKNAAMNAIKEGFQTHSVAATGMNQQSTNVVQFSASNVEAIQTASNGSQAIISHSSQIKIRRQHPAINNRAEAKSPASSASSDGISSSSHHADFSNITYNGGTNSIAEDGGFKIANFGEGSISYASGVANSFEGGERLLLPSSFKSLNGTETVQIVQGNLGPHTNTARVQTAESYAAFAQHSTKVVSQHSAYYRGPYTSTKHDFVENSEPVRNTECSFNNRPPLSSGQVRDNRNNFVVSSSERSSTVDSGGDSRTNSTNGSGDSENGSDNTSDQGEPSNGSEQSEEDVNQAETKRARHEDQITPRSVKEESIQNSREQLYS